MKPAHDVGKTVFVPFAFTPRRPIEFVKTALFCPNCGDREVWRNADGGDYYVGEQYLCVACKHSFYLPNETSDRSEDSSGIIAAIKSAQ